MNNIVENDFFALFEVVRPQYTGEVGKFITFCC